MGIINLRWDGRALSEVLSQRGLSLKEAATHLSRFAPPQSPITKRHLDNWINDGTVPSMRFAPAFILGLGIDILALFRQGAKGDEEQTN